MQKITSVLLGLLVITQIPQAFQAAHFNTCVDTIMKNGFNNTRYNWLGRSQKNAARWCNGGFE